jgi:hypothetical protein
MIPPRQRYVFKNKLLRVLSDTFSLSLLLSWFAYCGLVMSWAGHRPLSPVPTTGQVIPYNDHGVLFVTQRDLDTTHLILAFCVVFGLLAYVCYAADRKPWRKSNSN